MSLLIGALDVDDVDDGYRAEITLGGPIDYIADVRGARVLIPSRAGMYTPSTSSFADERLEIIVHMWGAGEGSTHVAQVTSFISRMAALKAACDVAGREDVVLSADGYTISAGFLRFEGPPIFAGMAREFDIMFEASDPPEWE